MQNGVRVRKKMQTKSERVAVEPSSGNVFADLELPSAEEELAKAKIVFRIHKAIEQRGLTQAQAGPRAPEIRDPDQLRDALFQAAERGDHRRLERLCRKNRQAVVDYNPGVISLRSRFPAARRGISPHNLFSISAALASNSFCHAGARTQSLSSWAPPTLSSCSAVGQ